jgi:hypothetical protein
MAFDATQVRVGLSGHLSYAPLGTTMPTDVATVLPIAWKELGYITEDGIVVTPNANIQDIMAWQTQYPVRRTTTSRDFTKKFKLMQRSTDSLLLAMGGGTVVVASGVSTYTPPSTSDTFERAFVFEITDGTIIDRWCLYRGTPSISGDIVSKKDQAVLFEVDVKALADSSGNTWKLVSNDANLVATS